MPVVPDGHPSDYMDTTKNDALAIKPIIVPDGHNMNRDISIRSKNLVDRFTEVTQMFKVAPRFAVMPMSYINVMYDIGMLQKKWCDDKMSKWVKMSKDDIGCFFGTTIEVFCENQEMIFELCNIIFIHLQTGKICADEAMNMMSNVMHHIGKSWGRHREFVDAIKASNAVTFQDNLTAIFAVYNIFLQSTTADQMHIPGADILAAVIVVFATALMMSIPDFALDNKDASDKFFNGVSFEVKRLLIDPIIESLGVASDMVMGAIKRRFQYILNCTPLVRRMDVDDIKRVGIDGIKRMDVDSIKLCPLSFGPIYPHHVDAVHYLVTHFLRCF